jgi:hypothetical protein
VRRGIHVSSIRARDAEPVPRACQVTGKNGTAGEGNIDPEARSPSSKHVEDIGFRQRSLGASVPAHVQTVRPQDDVLDLRV